MARALIHQTYFAPCPADTWKLIPGKVTSEGTSASTIVNFRLPWYVPQHGIPTYGHHWPHKKIHPSPAPIGYRKCHMKTGPMIAIGILLILFAIAPVMAAGIPVKLPQTRWVDTTSLIRGNSLSPVLPVSVLSPIQPVSVPTPTYTEKDNGKTYSLTRNTVVKVKLNENPTTGFSWKINSDPGVQVLSDNYQTSAPGRFGAGGTHTWVLKLTGTGILEFKGIYKQPWMPTTGNELSYKVSFNVK
jgi:inhibitor of cysteine peptidase